MKKKKIRKIFKSIKQLFGYTITKQLKDKKEENIISNNRWPLS